jgi:glucose-6-phosphate 1-epimerase
MPANDQTKLFDIPNALRFEEAPGGLTRAVISTPAADAELYLQGAHVTQWSPRGQRPVLFLSPRSLFAPGKPIRGGVPVIFPWFGPRGAGKPGPIHGFARILEWTVESTELRPDGNVAITLTLAPNDVTAHLRFRVIAGADLEMQLEVRNDAQEPLAYEEGLHTYFAIGDIQQVSVAGLAGTTYIDKTDSFQCKVTGGEPLRIARETDQVHLNTQATCVIHDPAWSRRIVIDKSGSDTTVVWNPWIEKTKTLSDMAPDDWQGMLCVETVNAAGNAIRLAAGATHTMTAKIRVE